MTRRSGKTEKEGENKLLFSFFLSLGITTHLLLWGSNGTNDWKNYMDGFFKGSSKEILKISWVKRKCVLQGIIAGLWVCETDRESKPAGRRKALSFFSDRACSVTWEMKERKRGVRERQKQTERERERDWFCFSAPASHLSLAVLTPQLLLVQSTVTGREPAIGLRKTPTQPLHVQKEATRNRMSLEPKEGSDLSLVSNNCCGRVNRSSCARREKSQMWGGGGCGDKVNV